MASLARFSDEIEENNIGTIISQRRKPPVRITLRVDSSLHQRVQSLVKRTGAENTNDVIRQALILYEALISEAESGKDIMVIDPTGARTRYPLFKRE